MLARLQAQLTSEQAACKHMRSCQQEISEELERQIAEVDAKRLDVERIQGVLTATREETETLQDVLVATRTVIDQARHIQAA